MQKMILVDVNEGHCQVTYKTKNEDGETFYYGLQEYEATKIRLMRCTSAGEPMYVANFKPEAMFEVELVPGSSRLIAACNKFINEHPNMKVV